MYTPTVMEHFRNPHNMGRMENPDGIGKVGNIVCLPPESKVHTNPGLKNISEITEGNRVLSHDGKFNHVEKKLVREYTGIVHTIKNRFGTTTLTPEHEVLAMKIPKTHHFLYLRNKRKFQPAWHHAQELEKNDIVLYPIPKETVRMEEIETDNEKKKFDYKSTPIPEKIKIDEAFLRLCGYYLAEGHLTDETTNTSLIFTFSIREKQYAEDVIQTTKKIFGLDAIERTIEKRKTRTVTVNNVFAVRLFKKLFGKGAEKKSIPHFMMLLEPEKQKALIKGLWCGDGCINLKRKWPRAGYSTISYALSQQIKTLLLRQKIIPSIYTEAEKTVKGVHHRKSYRIHVGSRDSLKKLAQILGVEGKITIEERNDSWVDGNFAYVPISSVEQQRYSGSVHNLSVAGAHSYTTDSLAVHNCGDVMWIYIKVKDNRIEDIKFETFGCVAAIATSSMVTDLAKGKTLEEALKITRGDVANSLGGLPPIKMHCSNLAADALAEAIHDYLTKNNMPVPEELKKLHEKAVESFEEIKESHGDYIEEQEKMH